jgi:hypothetical protein
MGSSASWQPLNQNATLEANGLDPEEYPTRAGRGGRPPPDVCGDACWGRASAAAAATVVPALQHGHATLGRLLTLRAQGPPPLLTGAPTNTLCNKPLNTLCRAHTRSHALACLGCRNTSGGGGSAALLRGGLAGNALGSGATAMACCRRHHCPLPPRHHMQAVGLACPADRLVGPAAPRFGGLGVDHIMPGHALLQPLGGAGAGCMVGIPPPGSRPQQRNH